MLPQNSISIVNLVNCYNNEAEVLAYAKMLASHNCHEILMLVVNVNSFSKNNNFENFENALSNAYNTSMVVTTGNNLGYLNGMIFSYNEFEKKCDSDFVKWIIMSNTDIIIEQSDFFKKLMSSNYPKDVVCIGPSIYSIQSKSYSNPQYLSKHTYLKLSILIFIMENYFFAFIYFYLAKLKAKVKNRRSKPDSSYMTEAHGCFFILNKAIMDKLKTKTYPCLMYSEESYISFLVHSNKKKIYYDSDLEIIHAENSVTKLLGVKKKSKMMAESLRFIRKLYYG